MDPHSVLSGFETYWKHWKIVEDWRRKHHEAFAATQSTLNELASAGKSNEFGVSHTNLNEHTSHFTKDYQDDIVKSEDMSYDESCCENDEIHQDDDDSGLEFVISEEMEAFFEQSMRHKLELKRQRELMEGGTETSDISTILGEINVKENGGKKKKGNNKPNVPFKIPAPSVNATEQKRTSEMTLLYGDAAPKICGMETAIQLSYNRLCDHHKPVHWPCIPFRP